MKPASTEVCLYGGFTALQSNKVNGGKNFFKTKTMIAMVTWLLKTQPNS
jgi:hypothetical protein